CARITAGPPTTRRITASSSTAHRRVGGRGVGVFLRSAGPRARRAGPSAAASSGPPQEGGPRAFPPLRRPGRLAHAGRIHARRLILEANVGVVLGREALPERLKPSALLALNGEVAQPFVLVFLDAVDAAQIIDVARVELEALAALKIKHLGLAPAE